MNELFIIFLSLCLFCLTKQAFAYFVAQILKKCAYLGCLELDVFSVEFQ